jgi:FixJ family two-component response regulator
MNLELAEVGSRMDLEPRVFVVDDDPICLRAVERLLRSHGFVVDTFASPKEFLERPFYDGPACLILDLSMPELSGLDVQEAMILSTQTMPTIFLSGTSNVEATAKAMRKGALDFLVKPVDDVALVDAVGRGLDASAAVRERRREEHQVLERLALLTRRERQVCDLIAKGLLNKQIAYELGTAEKTVKVHRGRVMRKLEVDSVAALVWLLSRVPKAEPVQRSSLG